MLSKKALLENNLKKIKPLSFASVIETLEYANDEDIEISHFDSLSKVARTRQHDTVILSGETGAGKSMLAFSEVL